MFASEGSHSTVAGSVVLSLVMNDIVYPFVENGDMHESTAKARALTSFTGFEVAPMAKTADDALLKNDVFREANDELESGLAQPDPEDRIEELFKSSRHVLSSTTT